MGRRPGDPPGEVTGPGDRYLVGRLGPKRAATDSRDPENQQVTDAENAAAGDNDPELPEVHTGQDTGRMWASSMGLSCVVDGVDTMTVVAEWGRYDKSEQLDDAGNRKTMWSREPVRREVHIRLDKKSQKHQLTGDGPGVYLQAEVRGTVLELSLVNAQDEPPRRCPRLRRCWTRSTP